MLFLIHWRDALSATQQVFEDDVIQSVVFLPMRKARRTPASAAPQLTLGLRSLLTWMLRNVKLGPFHPLSDGRSSFCCKLNSEELCDKSRIIVNRKKADIPHVPVFSWWLRADQRAMSEASSVDLFVKELEIKGGKIWIWHPTTMIPVRVTDMKPLKDLSLVCL